MNKKVMAIAVAGVFAAPAVAFAQASTVQIGGSYTVFYYQHSPKNPSTGQKTDILESSEPELFIRGEEKLGGGLSAWFQCTSSLDGTITGAASAQGLCGRNSGVGVKGAFGNLFAGNWDQPQKLVFNRARGWWGGTNSLTGGSATILNGGGASGTQNPLQTITAAATTTPVIGGASTVVTTAATGTAISNSPGGFYRRQASSWNYHSPVWNGFQVQGAFSASNEQTGIPEASPLSPRLWSLAAHYTNGPFYVGAGYERHLDYNPANVTVGTAAGTSVYGGGDDDNWTIVAGYTFAGVFSVRALYSRSEYDVSNGTNLKVDGWALFGDWQLGGPHTLRAQWAKVDDTSGNAIARVVQYKGPAAANCGAASASSCATATGAKVWGFAYSYALSKRTEASLVYTKLKNDQNATYSLGKVAATAGNSQTSAGLVFKHSF